MKFVLGLLLIAIMFDLKKYIVNIEKYNYKSKNNNKYHICIFLITC